MEIKDFLYNPYDHISQPDAAAILGIKRTRLSDNKDNPHLRWFKYRNRIYFFKEDILKMSRSRSIDNRINVIYARVCDDGDYDAMEYQINRINLLIAKDYPTLTISKIYKEHKNANSCAPDRRPILYELMTDINAGKIRNVFIYNKNRIAFYDTHIFETFCHFKGTTAIYTDPTENITHFGDEALSMGKLMLKNATKSV